MASDKGGRMVARSSGGGLSGGSSLCREERRGVVAA